MTDLVAGKEITRIVGCDRQPKKHMGRAVSSEGKLYILHSEHCVRTTRDLRTCDFSRALDRGTAPGIWEGYEDKPVTLKVHFGRLIPVANKPGETS